MSKSPNAPSPNGVPALSRRRVFAGAGLAGAAAAAATLLPGTATLSTAEPTGESLSEAGHGGGRYQETEHVRHYYRTARV